MGGMSLKRYAKGQAIDPERFEFQFWTWGERVFWHRFELPWADAATFACFNDTWAIDAQHVYCESSRVRDADRETFEVLNDIFARDKKRVYCNHGVCDRCDAATFEVLDAGKARYCDAKCGYARDAKNVFFHDSGEGNAKLLKGANRDSFRVIKGLFATDGKHVYVSGRRIPKANVTTFRPLGELESTDGVRVFHLHREKSRGG